MTKKELRAEAKRRIASCQPEQSPCHSEPCHFEHSREIFHDRPANSEKILALPEYKNAEIVLSYIAIENEADPIEITKAALKEGKKVAVPKIHGKSLASGDFTENEMDFYFLSPDRPIEAQLEKGAFGISEPTSNKKFAPETRPKNSDALSATKKSSAPKIFIVTPGLAFSKSGKRCGRGKGYYDRYFSRLKAAKVDFFAAGFCFPCQIFKDDEIPTDENDFFMDFI